MTLLARLTLIGLCLAGGVAAAAYLAVNAPAESATASSERVEAGRANARRETANSAPATPAADRHASDTKATAGSPRRGPLTATVQPTYSAAIDSDDGSPQAARHVELAQTFDVLDLKQQLQQLIAEQLTLPTPAAAAQESPAGAAPESPGADFGPEIEAPRPAPAAPGRPSRTRIEPSPVNGEGDNRLTIRIQDSELREVLEVLSEQSGLNILVSPSVQGRVSAVLQDVDLDSALAAILRSTGYVARRDEQFVFVGTPEEFQQAERSLDRIGIRVYRPNYVASKELQTLITPLLTEGLGKLTVSSAPESGIGTSSSDAGGDSPAIGETVIVQDYEAVLAVVDQIVDEVDRRPLQVAIEAMILSVRLNDSLDIGVSWQFLRQREHLHLSTGSPRIDSFDNGATGDGMANGEVRLTNNGLAFAFLDSNLGSFIEALETIGDTNVIATPRLMVLNKQRAEILIGAELGYVSTTVTETSTTQSVEFLEVGAQLRLRPYISSDGMIRMEVHPELSTGQVRIEEGFTLPDKELTAVTTNIMVADGCTMVIGGLMREDLQTSTSQVPVLGSLPAIGWLFRQKNEQVERREILVLITPHIVYEPDICCEGEQGACEFHRRHQRQRDHMSPIGKRTFGRKYLDLARQAWHQGKPEKALRYVRWAIHFDPSSRAAMELESEIISTGYGGPHHEVIFDPEIIEAGPLDGEELPPWMLDALQAPPADRNHPLHPRDPGKPGARHEVVRPETF